MTETLPVSVRLTSQEWNSLGRLVNTRKTDLSQLIQKLLRQELEAERQNEAQRAANNRILRHG